jgi:hypothetical protein
MATSLKEYEPCRCCSCLKCNRLLVGKPGGYKTSAHLNDGKDIGKDLSGGFYDAGGKQTMRAADRRF